MQSPSPKTARVSASAAHSRNGGAQKPMVAAVQGVIESDKPILTKINAIIAYALDHGVAYRMMVKAKDVVVHPSNRGKLGLAAYTAHRNGAKMVKIGADRKELHNAVAFELARRGAPRTGKPNSTPTGRSWLPRTVCWRRSRAKSVSRPLVAGTWRPSLRPASSARKRTINR